MTSILPGVLPPHATTAATLNLVAIGKLPMNLA